MRLWVGLTGLMEPALTAYLERFEDLFANIERTGLRFTVAAHAVLLQVDYQLKPREGATPNRLSSQEECSYTGWLRDLKGDRVFSALRQDALPVDPLAGRTVGEFSYCSISGHRMVAFADHYSTHPIYYCSHGSRVVAVASDPRPLLILEGLEPALNEYAVREFLSTSVMVGENELEGQKTFFKGVLKLRSGTFLAVEDGLIRVLPCAFPWVEPSQESSRRLSQEAWAESLKEILCSCVSDRIAAGANSICLSGGVDSSCVLGAYLQVAPDNPPLCLNMGFKDPALVMSQDQNLLRAYFQETSIPNIMLQSDPFLRYQDHQDPLYFLDGPDPSAHPLSKEAFSQAFAGLGEHMALTGEGGDIVLGETTAHLIMDSICQTEGARALVS